MLHYFSKHIYPKYIMRKVRYHIILIICGVIISAAENYAILVTHTYLDYAYGNIYKMPNTLIDSHIALCI